jgi:hypothetical protein
MEHIKILNIEKQKDSGSLKYLVEVQIGEIITRDWRVVKPPNGKAFIAAPQILSYDKEGGKHRKSLVSVPPNIRESIEHLIYSSVDLQEDTNGNGTANKE